MNQITANSPLYKVLQNGASFHGGSLQWSLPARDVVNNGWSPGDWHEVGIRVEACKSGLHLTTEPARWMAIGATVYLAEIDDAEAFTAPNRIQNDKIAVSKARLVRPLTAEELRGVKIYVAGITQDVHAEGVGFVLGGTIESVLGGTIKSVEGGTIESVRGGTIESVEGGANITTFCGCKPGTVEGKAVWVDRSDQNAPPKIVVGGVQYAPVASARGKD